jgi:hypothetical protein
MQKNEIFEHSTPMFKALPHPTTMPKTIYASQVVVSDTNGLRVVVGHVVFPLKIHYQTLHIFYFNTFEK